jgi:hypothetical protein
MPKQQVSTWLVAGSVLLEQDGGQPEELKEKHQEGVPHATNKIT